MAWRAVYARRRDIPLKSGFSGPQSYRFCCFLPFPPFHQAKLAGSIAEFFIEE
jgi:hypothetical protein